MKEPSETPTPLRVLAAIFGVFFALGGIYLAKQVALPIQDESGFVSWVFAFLGMLVAWFAFALAWTFIEFSIKGDV